MRIAASTVLLGAASASFHQQAQHVLSNFDNMKPISGSFDSLGDMASAPLEALEKAFGTMSAEAKAVWEEIKLLVPESAFKQGSWFSKPKPHTRRQDHVVKGADVQKLWVQDADGQSHRKVGGRLESYDLRVKAVDPSVLGIDTVKQYSGYLDDNENDKHLFYCTYHPASFPHTVCVSASC
jgi:cathepsin A (carboxypeptidase C)